MEREPPTVIAEAEDVSEEILRAVEDCLDWFGDRKGLNTEDFIDRLSDTYGGWEWELDRYDSPAAKKIMREARKMKRELDN